MSCIWTIWFWNPIPCIFISVSRTCYTRSATKQFKWIELNQITSIWMKVKTKRMALSIPNSCQTEFKLWCDDFCFFSLHISNQINFICCLIPSEVRTDFFFQITTMKIAVNIFLFHIHIVLLCSINWKIKLYLYRFHGRFFLITKINLTVLS